MGVLKVLNVRPNSYQNTNYVTHLQSLQCSGKNRSLFTVQRQESSILGDPEGRLNTRNENFTGEIN